MAKVKQPQAIELSDKDASTTLIRMTRAEPAHVGGPTAADVHPDEVQDYLAGGWVIAEEE